jgi:flagellar biosynthesis/type III secretory pathway chaperone
MCDHHYYRYYNDTSVSSVFLYSGDPPFGSDPFAIGKIKHNADSLFFLSFQKCNEATESNRTYLTTFVRTEPSILQSSKSIVSLLKSYNWTSFSIIAERKTKYLTTTKTLRQLALSNNMVINHELEFENKQLHIHAHPFKEAIMSSYAKTRSKLMLISIYMYFNYPRLYNTGSLLSNTVTHFVTCLSRGDLTQYSINTVD